ncbi:MAG: GAF and ANTAR domain-containing protein [Actinomycetes bacterium]
MQPYPRPPGSAEPTVHTALIEVLQDIARQLYVSEDLEASLLRLTQLATQMLGGCDVASVSLLDGDHLVTVAATEPVAHQLDQMQYDEGEGPCVYTAVGEHWVYTPSLADDERWPRFSRRVAKEFGMGSLLACQLARIDDPEHKAGAINLYSRRPDAFSDSDGMIGLLIGAHAGVLVDAARQHAGLRRALESRDVIGQAKGILMAQRGISEQEAFDQLVEVSQQFNIKLRDLARMVSDSTTRGEDLPSMPASGTLRAARPPDTVS